MKKFAPLLILGMFLIGVYFMIQGMEEANELAHPTKTTQNK